MFDEYQLEFGKVEAYLQNKLAASLNGFPHPVKTVPLPPIPQIWGSLGAAPLIKWCNHLLPPL